MVTNEKGDLFFMLVIEFRIDPINIDCESVLIKGKYSGTLNHIHIQKYSVEFFFFFWI